MLDVSAAPDRSVSATLLVHLDGVARAASA